MKEAFDSATSAEFIRLVRYAKQSKAQTCLPSLSLRRGGLGGTYIILDAVNGEAPRSAACSGIGYSGEGE